MPSSAADNSREKARQRRARKVLAGYVLAASDRRYSHADYITALNRIERLLKLKETK